MIIMIVIITIILYWESAGLTDPLSEHIRRLPDRVGTSGDIVNFPSELCSRRSGKSTDVAYLAPPE